VRAQQRTWGPLGAPPYTQVFLMRLEEPNFWHSCWIWTASSRVGASTSTMGPSPGSAHRCSSRYASGKCEDSRGSCCPRCVHIRSQRCSPNCRTPLHALWSSSLAAK